MLAPPPKRLAHADIAGIMGVVEASDAVTIGVKAGNTRAKKDAKAKSRRGTRQRERDQLVLAKHVYYDEAKVVEALLIDGRYLQDPDADQKTVETALSKFLARMVGWAIARSKE